MSVQILTVTQLNKYVKALLDENSALKQIYIKGEISNFKHYASSGHCYFTLKDKTAAIRCVMFSSSAKFLKFMPQDGMAVILGGSVTLYEKDGAYQFYATDMQPEGIGALTIAYEQLKEKLSAQGIFSEDIKKPLPQMPKTIGIVTAQGGAALQDMLNILSRRYPIGKVRLYPVAVQGVQAAPTITKAINFVNEEGICDVIIVGRGGGSIEDLWAFNEEAVVMAVYNSEIPVISAVGHEVDYTLCDFAADRRAATPSEAAEIVALDIEIISAWVNGRESAMKKLVHGELDRYKSDIQNKDNLIKRHHPKKVIDSYRNLNFNSEKQLIRLMKNSINLKKQKLESQTKLLAAQNPMEILARGYTITTGTDNKSLRDVAVGEEMITLTDTSKITSTILDITRR